MAFKLTNRETAATRDMPQRDGLRSLQQLATEREQLPSFLNAKGSRTSLYIDVHNITTFVSLSGGPIPHAPAAAPAPALPAPRMDRDGDTEEGLAVDFEVLL
ncbi:hypothetical protein E4U58_000330 [Claviceps cyperi]|nr:hypothetical protein E4U58_000330 [Claviceps cyperi]